MKKIIFRITALVMCMLMFSSVVVPVKAATDETYTYFYDVWDEVQNTPDAYTVSKSITSSDLGLDKDLRNPLGLTCHGNYVYICDTGNNRIVCLEKVSKENLTVVGIYDHFNGDVENNTFNGPTDFQVSEDGNLFIADKGNSRILKLDPDWNYIMEFTKPVDNTLDPQTSFTPHKIAIDSAERVYCVASGINKGFIKYENDGVFSGFVGATPVQYNLWQYIKKRFATQEQIERMAAFVPTEYDDLYMDKDGFIYAVIGSAEEADLKDGSADEIRKINMNGSDILVRNGFQSPYGDLYMGSGGGYQGPSYFTDITCFDNEVYIALDRNRGRLFAYNNQGEIMFAFGGNGNMDGYFWRPVALDHIGYDLFVLDSIECSITMFIPTEFGTSIYAAMDLFDAGEYEASEAAWRKVMELDGNYDRAYIGIGRALLRQKQYKEAMEYFELKLDDDNYSKAFKQYRKIWVEENIGIIITVLLVVILVPLGIGRYRKVKRDMELSEYFQK